jgi:hypothetical protein
MCNAFLQEVLWRLRPLRLPLSLSVTGPETALRRSSSLHKKVDDGTALVRFAAGNFRIVPMELLKPATEAEAEEYYSSAEA